MIEGDLYLKNNLEGMNNDELILYIYQEMLKVLNQTRHYFDVGDIEKRVIAINKGIEVLNALLSILNYDEGGEIAARLRSLYLYSIKKLTTANFDMDPQPVEEVVQIFKNLHTTWAEKIAADRKNNAGNSGVTNFKPPAPSTPATGGYGSNDGGQGLEIYG